MHLKQLFAEIYGCGSALADGSAISAAAEAGAAAVGATVVGRAAAQYSPHGLTVVVFLAESHIIVTTWPEYRLAVVEISVCNPHMDPRKILDSIAAELSPHTEIRSSLTTRDLAMLAAK